MIKFLCKLFALSCALVAVAGCKTTDVNGKFVNDEIITKIKKEKPNKDALLEELGTPTYVPDYSPNKWYYIQRSVQSSPFTRRTLLEQKVVAIDFTDSGYVSSIQVMNEMPKHDIEIAKDATPSLGTQSNGVQKFMKNIGRFNKKKDGKKKKKKN